MIDGAYLGWGIRSRATGTVRSVLPSGPAAWVAIRALIQSQTQTVMLAEVRPEYVFKTIDHVVVPEEKSKPSRVLIGVLGTLLGGMLGVVIVLIRHYAESASGGVNSDNKSELWMILHGYAEYVLLTTAKG